MAWILLLLAGLFEVVWALGLRYTEGFSRWLPSTLTLAAMAASVVLLALAVRVLPLGTAYAVWTGIGTMGAAIGGIVLFSEPITALRCLFLGFILLGIIGLKLF